MAAQYLLPCECGKTTPIDTNQAGSSVSCECGKFLEVPSLRAIRELTPHNHATAVKYQWNPAAGLTFVSGLVIAMVSAGVALNMYFYTNNLKQLESPPQEVLDAWVNEINIEDAPADELMDMWMMALDTGLGEYTVSPLVQAREAIGWSESCRNLSLIVMVCGLAFAGSSFFLRRKGT